MDSVMRFESIDTVCFSLSELEENRENLLSALRQSEELNTQMAETLQAVEYFTVNNQDLRLKYYCLSFIADLSYCCELEKEFSLTRGLFTEAFYRTLCELLQSSNSEVKENIFYIVANDYKDSSLSLFDSRNGFCLMNHFAKELFEGRNFSLNCVLKKGLFNCSVIDSELRNLSFVSLFEEILKVAKKYSNDVSVLEISLSFASSIASLDKNSAESLKFNEIPDLYEFIRHLSGFREDFIALPFYRLLFQMNSNLNLTVFV